MRRHSILRALPILLVLSPGLARVTAQELASSKPATLDYIRNVDPFIGVDWGGNTFVGSTVPFGMVKVGPDMETFDGRRSGFGYSSHGVILGFSHLHLSGAQGKYGNILVAPVTGPLDIADIKSPREKEIAQAGYYAATLTRYSVRAELTSSRRVGFHRYTFANSGDAHITLNAAAALGLGTGSESQNFLGAEVHVVSNHEVQGVARFRGGWNKGGEYRVFYDLLLDTPATKVRVWTGTELSADRDATVAENRPIGVTFDLHAHAHQVVQAKVGISFISAAQARQNIQTEIPGWSFEVVHQANTALWNAELGKLQLSGATERQRRELYTAMYHVIMMPVNRTGENPGWSSTEPYYDDYYAIWDTYRTSSPLLTLIAPGRQRDIIRSLIDIYRHTGYMPDARSGNDNGRTQGGSNANVVVADAYVKGLSGIDYATALQAMLHDAEVPPQDAQKEGRGGLKDYNARGYITTADERAGSRTVEYAYDDFAIAEVACGLGQAKQAARALARAHNFEHLWDPNMSVSGFKGFLRPRKPDGSWADPYLVVRGTWPDFMYEGDIWTYSLYAPQDMRRLIEMAGGEKEFNARMDFIFSRGHFDIANEPGFLMPLLYNYSRRPDKSADIVHLLLEKAFNDTRAGIPGNDDSGAMSSWLLFQSLGIFPVAGQDIYLISSPSVSDASLALGNGRRLHILTKGFDSSGLNRYVQSATLNGENLQTNWFRHAQIKDGATLMLTMGSSPSTWGTGTPPPSLSDSSARMCVPISAK
ncbi:GH92 family glycosyl hydrolase [Edaphobacter sp. HDX4]|uniref:GH92 family glycosyl hydrolase n=1 Tax=Edaphobacter sp. HDX4 TaxID=2794064 RepID=UPI002FE6C4A8